MINLILNDIKLGKKKIDIIKKYNLTYYKLNKLLTQKIGGETNNNDLSKIKEILFSSKYNKLPTNYNILLGSESPIETIDDIKHPIKYNCNTKINKYSTHNGQRKLFLNELQFLTNFKNIPYCIYAGSAPSVKLYYLSQLFPNVKFICIDPNMFRINVNGKLHRNIKHKDIVHIYSNYKYSGNTMPKSMNILNFVKNSKYKIYIIEDYMTIEKANMLKDLNSVFISDIRSREKNMKYPSEADIIWNNSMNYNWINILRPVASMLKIRIFSNSNKTKLKIPSYMKESLNLSKKNGIDFLKDYNSNKLKFPKSKLYLQPWAPVSSTELRAVIKKQDINNIINYDMLEIENKMFYYNNFNRAIKYHINKNANKQLGFCNCNDCALENLIWKKYGYNNKQINSAVKSLEHVVRRKLKDTHKNNIYSINNNFTELHKLLNNYVPLTKYKIVCKRNKGDAVMELTNK